jgi:enoyl-CoA hydratase
MPPVATANPIDAPAVRFAAADGIGTVTFSNPARMNALTAGMWSALPGLIEQAEADPAVRVIILRGAGEKAFSAGADISEFESARTGDNAQSYDALNDAVFNALQAATKPVIAMIHGFCLGGGLGIAACCDLRSRLQNSASGTISVGSGPSSPWLRRIVLKSYSSPATASARLTRCKWGWSIASAWRQSYSRSRSIWRRA